MGSCFFIGAENKVPVGLLEIQLELVPRITDTVSDQVISAQISLEKGKQAERERLFLVYAKQWWKEYLQIRPSHKDRLVKIFAQVSRKRLYEVFYRSWFWFLKIVRHEFHEFLPSRFIS